MRVLEGDGEDPVGASRSQLEQAIVEDWGFMEP